MISEELIQQFVKETELFEERLRAFEAGEIDRKTFKGISGRFGCYAQREKNYMLRLRFPGGRISKEHLAFLGEKTREYPLELMKITTCQTIQVHNLSASQVVSLMREALQKGIITIGGGGDNPRNVMSSPLSGADSQEAFDVLPYAETVSDYLISRMTELHLPRKLKVAFSKVLVIVHVPTFPLTACFTLGNTIIEDVSLSTFISLSEVTLPNCPPSI